MNRAHLSQLAVFATVAQCASFRGAARELGIAPSAVSHAVSSLEARLGVRLLARSTRSVAPTEEGAQLLERLRPALSEIDLALESAVEARDRPAGNLRLSVPRTAAHLVLTPRLGAFVAAYPDIVLEIVIEDRFTDVVEAGFDAGVRLGESLQRDMIAVRIGPDIRGAVVGAPSYFKTAPGPRHPRDLAAHRCLRFRFASGILYRWEFAKDGEEIEIAAHGPLILDEDHLIVRAAIDGAGIAFVFEDYVRAPLADGRLIRVLEDWCPSFDGFFVYYPTAVRCGRRYGRSWISSGKGGDSAQAARYPKRNRATSLPPPPPPPATSQPRRGGAYPQRRSMPILCAVIVAPRFAMRYR